jgi:DNA modification methylase
MSKNVLLNGDCLEMMDKLIDKGVKVDAIITDPPYNISRKSGYVNNSPDKKEYIAKYGKHAIDFGEWDNKDLLTHLIFEKITKLLKNSGTLLWFYDIWKMQEIKQIAIKCKLKQPRICEWVKTNPVPINSNLNYLSNAKEYFCTFVKKSKPTFNSKYDNGIYSFPICHGKERTKHPTQKPLKLMEELVLKHTNESDLIFDPFMGSGTTGVACKNLNRKFIGIELDENYYNIAKERINRKQKNY